MKSLFLSCLQFVDVAPLHKKGRNDVKQNYRLVSILVVQFMKEACLCLPFLKIYFLNTSAISQKVFSTQQCLFTLLEKWKNSFDKDKIFGALLTNLSKIADCLNHKLLIVKLNAYGFTWPALKLIYNYLSSIKQRVWVNDSYILCQDILFGVQQGSILGPFLFLTCFYQINFLHKIIRKLQIMTL